MNPPFAPGQVWEMSYEDDADAFVFYILSSVERPGAEGMCWWNIFILESAPIFSAQAGAVKEISLRDVSFYHGVIGYDSYDNAYTRLA